MRRRGVVASYPGCVGGEKHFSPPMWPWYDARGAVITASSWQHTSLRSHSKTAKEAKQLWEYLVHQEDIRESFIHYIFTNKVSHHKLLGTTALWSVAKVQYCSFLVFTVACCLRMRLVECSNYLKCF